MNKFRVWKDYAAEYEYFTLQEMMLSKEDDLSRIRNTGGEKFEQYIRIKDKKGIEIYEGDEIEVAKFDYCMVSFPKSLSVVRLSRGAFGFDIKFGETKIFIPLCTTDFDIEIK